MTTETENVYRPRRSKEKLLGKSLSPREIEVLKLLGLGKANKEIATDLKKSGNSEEHLTNDTVKNHVDSVIGKLGAVSRTHAVLIALDRNLLTIDELSEGLELELFEKMTPFRQNLLKMVIEKTRQGETYKQVSNGRNKSKQTLRNSLSSIYADLHVTSLIPAMVLCMAAEQKAEQIKLAKPEYFSL